MAKSYDVLVIGPVSLDHNIDYLGNERKEVGGAVVASGFAAARSGNATALFTKLNPADADVEARFAGSGADLYWKPSKATCSIRNQYFTADKEKRACTSMGVCDPFRFESSVRHPARRVNSRELSPCLVSMAVGASGVFRTSECRLAQYSRTCLTSSMLLS